MLQLTAKQQKEPPPCSGMSVLTQVNEPWFSWVCMVWLNQRSKRNSKNLLRLPGRRTSPSYLSQLKQNKEIIVHCGNYSQIFEQKKNEQMTFLPGQVKKLGAATVKGDKEKQWWFFWKKKWELLAGLAPSNFIYCNRAWALVIWVTLLAQIFLQVGPEQLCLTSEKTPESPRTLAPEKVIRSNLLHWPTAQPLTGKKPCTLLLSSSPTEVKGQALNPLFIKKNPLTLVKRHILHALSRASQSAKCCVLPLRTLNYITEQNLAHIFAVWK